jgi:Htaa
VTTAPGIAAALLGHGIVPIATPPGTAGAQTGSGEIAVRFTFPVTGGWLDAAKLSGTVWHQGGILFLDPAAGKQIQVSDFVISVHQGVLTAEVNGNPKVRVPLLRLSLAHATISSGRHYVQISGIVLTLTSGAASALDTTFGTTLFQPGLELGTASTLLRF